jgi:ligand-binding sensor domain-containing protein
MPDLHSRKPLTYKVVLSSLLAVIGVSCHAALIPLYAPAAPPQNDLSCSSTREVRSLFLRGDVLWVATAGGVLQRDSTGTWQKWTTRDGLPTNEVRGFGVDAKGELIAQTPRGAARFNGEKWIIVSTSSTKIAHAAITAQAKWREVSLEATLAGLRFKKIKPETVERDAPAKTEPIENNTQDEAQVQVLALPDGVGTHISALLPRESDVVVALFGDGLWLTDGKEWQKAPAAWQVPVEATEITALAGNKAPEWLGTRRDGLWHYENGAWKQQLQDNEPFEHNAQAMQEYKGALFVSTLEDGLSVRSGEGWQTVGDEFLSSNAPRQMVQFQEKLFVRHGGGTVDQSDGFSWRPHVFPALPRKKVLAIAADKDQLYLGQWGGWSEWDGKAFSHHLSLPALQGLPPMALMADGDKLWFATQSRGLGEVERKTGKVRWHDERHGLSDDWITCLLKVKTEIFAGTFVGGLVRWDGAKWHQVEETRGENITSLGEDGYGGVFIATRHGVWQRSAEGKMTLLNKGARWLEPEAQALYPTTNGLWIGTRTGLFFLKRQEPKAMKL